MGKPQPTLEPQQARSRESLRKLLQATRYLLEQKGWPGQLSRALPHAQV
jgi:hypothetical protein